jgi:hypothetical protein
MDLAQSVLQLATCSMVRESNPGRVEIFRTCAKRRQFLPSILYNEYRSSSSGVKRPGCGFDKPQTSAFEVKKE